MLSKWVCKKCWGEDWCGADDGRWDNPNHYVFCHGSKDEATSQLDTKDSPPPWCQYKLEHGISETMEKKDVE
jgi:hypothetical protein